MMSRDYNYRNYYRSLKEKNPLLDECMQQRIDWCEFRQTPECEKVQKNYSPENMMRAFYKWKGIPEEEYYTGHPSCGWGSGRIMTK
jgi:hypothetical protein